MCGFTRWPPVSITFHHIIAMTTANLSTGPLTPSINSSPYSASPGQVQRVPDSVLKQSKENESLWNTGADEGLNEVHIDPEPAGYESASRIADRRPDQAASQEAAAQMSQPKPIPASRQSQRDVDAGYLGASRETSYLHCCTAASIGLIVLSVASFVIPSISTVAEDRSSAQAFGYTAGVISLLSGLAAGACVISVYKKSNT